MKHWYWLSFSADNTGFRGACLVKAESFMGAIQEAWNQKCNPGGEVKGVQVLDCGDGDLEALDPFKPNRLYSKSEIENLGGAEPF